ncbi:hypothetical protein Btru_011161 [Bulinus truncatus]|nr:hypothetical protein Btru_011161 [Bulinus truncatus]
MPLAQVLTAIMDRVTHSASRGADCRPRNEQGPSLGPLVTMKESHSYLAPANNCNVALDEPIVFSLDHLAAYLMPNFTPGEAMSSQNKTTNNEFLDPHNSPLDEIMKSDSNGLSSKDETSIQDLARYLSCPTPPSSHKDTMMMDDKRNMPETNYSQQSGYNAAQEVSQVDMGHMCSSVTSSSFGAGTSHNSETTCSHPNDQQQQQYIQHSFSQSLPVFPDSVSGSAGQMNIIYSSNSSVGPTTFENSSPHQNSVDQSHLQTLSEVTGSDIHFFHDGQNGQYQHSETAVQFHPSLQTEYANNNTRSFQNIPQTDASSFQNSSVLANSFSSTNNQVQFGSSQENLGFGMMDVNSALLSNQSVDSSRQFKTPEKMHVDEPEGLFNHHTDINSNNNEYFQFKPANISASESDMQTYQTQSCLQQPSEASSFIPLNTFQPSLDPSTNDYPASGTTVNSSNGGYDNPTATFQPSSLANSFDSTNFMTSSVQSSSNLLSPTNSFQPDFHLQQSSIQSNSPLEMHYSSTKPTNVNEAGSPDFTMQSSPGEHNFVPSQNTASNSGQYQETTVVNLSSSDQQPSVMTDTLTSSSEFSMLTKQSMESAQPMSGEQFQQTSLTNYNGDTSLTSNSSTPTSLSTPSQEVLTHQQNFMTNSIPSGNFMNFSPTNPVTMHQVQDLNVKASSELSITEFPNSLSSSLSGLNHFQDDDAFPHLDIEAVVTGNFAVDSNLSNLQHRSINLESSPQSGGYGGYPFENNTQSVSFSETPVSVTNTSSQSDFNHQTQPQMSTSFLQASPHSSNPQDVHNLFHLQPNQFSSNKNGVHFNLHGHEHFPQPMQVQEADFAKKISEPSSVFSFPNHGISMQAGGSMESHGISMQAGGSMESHGISLQAGGSLESAMDISSNSNERSISYEDIHRSIVKAGNSFVSDSSEAIPDYSLHTAVHTANETATSESSHAQQTYSTESSPFYDVGKPIGNLCSVSETSSTDPIPAQVTFPSSTEYNSLLKSSLSVHNEHVTPDMFNNNSSMTTSGSANNNLKLLANNLQSDIIPNFLDHPAVVTISSIDSRLIDGGSVDIQMNVSESQTCFTGSLDSSATVVSSTNLSHPSAIPNTNISSMQEQNQSSPLFVGQPMFQNSVLNSSLDQCSMSSTKEQSSFSVPSTDPSIIHLMRTANATLPIIVQIPSSHIESKAVIGNLEQNMNLSQKPRLATVVIPTVGSPGHASANQNSHQIIKSLEELQKLLSQQSLSQNSSYSTVHQQAPLPQTLVLQKPTSSNHQWLKLNQLHPQPRLFIKGSSSQQRHIQPQQQLQQTREKLLLVQQSIPSQLNRNLDNNQAENQKLQTPFNLLLTQKDQPPQSQKLQLLQPVHALDQQPKIAFQLKQAQASQNLVYQVVPSPDQSRPSFQFSGQKPPGSLIIEHKPLPTTVSSQQLNAVYQTQLRADRQQIKKQQEQDQEEKCLAGLDISDRSDRQCSDNIKKEYKHLHSLLTGDSSITSLQSKPLQPVLTLPGGFQSNVTFGSTSGFSATTSSKTFTSVTTASFSFLPPTLSLPTLSSNSIFVPPSTASVSTSGSLFGNSPSAPLSTLAFTNTFPSSFLSKSVESRDFKTDMNSSSLLVLTQQSQNPVPAANITSDSLKFESSQDQPARNNVLVGQNLSDRKRSHTPLSIDIHSPNSNSEGPSPLSSPVLIEDGNTQATLIERSADLQIKSDTMQGMNDDDENASFFDLNSFHKRPSTEEVLSPGRNEENVPMKILKGSLCTDARSSVQTPLSPDQTFDIGSVVSTASNFSFAFGNKEDNSEVFTFGSGGAGTSTTESLKYKSGSKHSRLSNAKPSLKAQNMARSAIPTQQVRPVSRKQKEYSLKAYYPSKVENMELKIIEQPESHHRARYQTEGSRGAIKDASQQGFPIIKLVGYNKPTKLQVFIGDECGRVKPHGFYQACRVFGKNSTACTEQEIEGTTVIDVDILPENDMTVKLDCIGILKLRNADVERRIGPKRARDKKKNNTRARLVLRTTVEKSDGSFHVLQAVSNPIVCTQPVGQPEICRMSIIECASHGGDSLFIIGKNFKNKGTSVLFQKLDPSEEIVVWQAEAEIEQEFFQPTHLICKVPAYKDKSITKPEKVQIVVSCAGKKSDSQGFTYKPVYQMAESVKQEDAMETSSSSLSKALSFVSPEALHLNQMVQESSTTSSIFQLPPGAVPTLQSSSPLKPSKLSGLHGATKASPSATVHPLTTFNPSPGSSSETAVQTFLLEGKSGGLASSGLDPGTGNMSQVKNEAVHVKVHKNSDTCSAGPSNYSISGESPMILSANTKQSSSSIQSTCLESALSSKPIVVVLDTGNLQSDSSSKITQLLQQILEAQNKK